MNVNGNKITAIETPGPGDQIEPVKSMQHVLPGVSPPELCGAVDVNSRKETTNRSEEMSDEAFMLYCVPPSLALAAGTFLMRYRQRRATTTVAERFLLGGITYFGAAIVGATLGYIGYEQATDNKGLQADVARRLKLEQNRR